MKDGIKDIDMDKMTVNVGIRYKQKKEIAKILKYGQSINQFVQNAVQVKLDALLVSIEVRK